MRKRLGLLWLIGFGLLVTVACRTPASVVPLSGEGVAVGTEGIAMAETPSAPPQHSQVESSLEPVAPTPGLDEEAGPTRGGVVLTVAYDNHANDATLETAWGFACLIETPDGVVLFDTGGDGRMLLSNLEALGFDVQRIDAVVLSHIHTDHVGGLGALLGRNDELVVYLPQSFPSEFKARVAARAQVVEVSGPTAIIPGVRSTGEVGTAIVEQSLMVETSRGLVVLTGCAHPGVEQMVSRSREFGPVHLVMGGFHLGEAGSGEVQQVIDQFIALGVETVAPCHCTGERAIAAFAEAFGPAFIQAGVGTVISIDE